jgi:DNA-binding transcriptional LysR family regulator
VAADPPQGEAEATRLPRLDAGDVDLGLRYLPECRVLVVAEPLHDDALRVVIDAAAYHGAQLIVIGEARDVPDTATVLEAPAERGAAFIEVVARYANALDDGRAAPDAWRDAVDQTGWEQSSE